MEEMIANDPSLLEKESSTFHEIVSNELERYINNDLMQPFSLSFPPKLHANII
jgi:hypothetical protein